jgi:WD40 repeat protein
VAGRQEFSLTAGAAPLYKVAFRPDGKWLVAAGADGGVRVWDTGKRHLVRTIACTAGFNPGFDPSRGRSSAVTDLAFSPDGQQLATTVMNEATVRVWDVTTGKELWSLTGNPAQTVSCVAFSPDGSLLASGGWPNRPKAPDRTVRIWDVASRREVRTLTGHTHSVNSVAFSPDGRWLASAGDDLTVRIWDPATGRPLRTLRGHLREVNCAVFSPDGQRLVSASTDQTVKVWDQACGQEGRTLIGHTDPVRGLAFSPDGKQLATVSSDRTVKLWNPVTGQAVRTFKGLLTVAFSPDGRTLVSAGSDGTIRTWDAASGKELHVLAGHRDWVPSVVFSPDGKLLAAGSRDDTVKVWDAASGRELATFPSPPSVLSLAFSPDGERLAVAGFSNVRVLDAASGEVLRSLDGHTNGTYSVAFSPDGLLLASAGNDGLVRVWHAGNGQKLFTLKGHIAAFSSLVHAVAFSPDSRRLASAGGQWQRPGEVKVWDMASGEELLTLRGHTNEVMAVAFSADGWLASASSDNTVKMWDGRPWIERRAVEREAAGLVDFLFDKPLLKPEVIAQVRASKTIRDEVREQALVMAESWPENPERLRAATWEVVRQPGAPAERYRQALRWAEAAHRLNPDDYQCVTTLGVAQYRVGQYPEALATLTRGGKLTDRGGPVGHPVRLAFLAMTHLRLGQKDQALAALDTSRQLLNFKPPVMPIEKVQPFLREAEMLLEGNSSKPKK